MMRIWNKAGNSSEERERFDLEVCCAGNNVLLIQCDVRVVLFVDVEVLHKTLPEEVVECEETFLELLKEME